jgi:hypothetical protein
MWLYSGFQAHEGRHLRALSWFAVVLLLSGCDMHFSETVGVNSPSYRTEKN